jgi:hypothetical protein
MERHLLLPLVPFYRPQPPEAEDSDAVPDLLDADSDTDSILRGSDTDSDTDSEGIPDLLNWDDVHTQGDDDEVPPLIGEDSMPPLIEDDSMPALCSDDSDDDVSDDEGPPPLVGEDSDDDEDLPPLESINDGACPEQLKSSFSDSLRIVLGSRLTGLSTYDGFSPEEKARVRQYFGGVSRSPKAIGNLGRFGNGLNENQVTSCNVPVVLRSSANGRVETYVTYPELSGVNKLWHADVSHLPGGPPEVPATGGLLQGEKHPVDCTGMGAATIGGQLQGRKCPVEYPGSGATKEAEPQEWSTGLFDCCVDMRTCKSKHIT